MKNPHSNEDFWKTLATQYAQETGEEYLRELAVLEQEGLPVPGLDDKTGRALRREKFRKRRVAWGAAAACLALLAVVVTNNMWPGDGPGRMTDAPAAIPAPAAPAPLPDMAMGAPAAPAPLPDMAADAPAAAEALDALPNMTWGMEAQPPGPRAAAGEIDRHHLLSLTAPEGWQVVHISRDGDMTFFRLESATGNTVAVSTAPSGAPADYDGFRPIQIGGTQAYLLAASDYSILIYEQDNLQFTLTTPYDYRDLLALASYWLEATSINS